jgi:hypothetical protein
MAMMICVAFGGGGVVDCVVSVLCGAGGGLTVQAETTSAIAPATALTRRRVVGTMFRVSTPSRRATMTALDGVTSADHVLSALTPHAHAVRSADEVPHSKQSLLDSAEGWMLASSQLDDARQRFPIYTAIPPTQRIADEETLCEYRFHKAFFSGSAKICVGVNTVQIDRLAMFSDKPSRRLDGRPILASTCNEARSI